MRHWIVVAGLIAASPAAAQDVYGIVVDSDTGAVKRLLKSENDRDLDNPTHVQPGETMFRVPKAGFTGELDAIQKLTGRSGQPKRAAIVDADGNVIGAIMADPAKDPSPVPGTTLVEHAHASPGWKTKDGGKSFEAPPDPPKRSLAPADAIEEPAQ